MLRSLFKSLIGCKLWSITIPVSYGLSFRHYVLYSLRTRFVRQQAWWIRVRIKNFLFHSISPIIRYCISWKGIFVRFVQLFEWKSWCFREAVVSLIVQPLPSHVKSNLKDVNLVIWSPNSCLSPALSQFTCLLETCVDPESTWWHSWQAGRWGEADVGASWRCMDGYARMPSIRREPKRIELLEVWEREDKRTVSSSEDY